MLTEIFYKILQKFSKTPKKPEFFADHKEDNTYFTITTGKYKDVIVVYNNTKITEEGEYARLQFSYDVMYSGSFSIEDLTNNVEFDTILGDMLQEYIRQKALENEST